MSTVKKAALKLAQENSEFRRALLKELKAAMPSRQEGLGRMGSRKIPPETPLQKAVWNAWDYLQGVEKIPEHKSLLFVLGGVEG